MQKLMYVFNPSPEMYKENDSSFAGTFNFYQLFWVFFIGSFLGVILEMTWCLLTKGYVESRTGLMIGLFNPVYGFGALALTIGLYWMRNKNNLYIFIGGMILGSGVEYISSWVQEHVIGTISWDYSGQAFNLVGRTSLLYAFYWGLVAILWMRIFYPFFLTIIYKIPNSFGKQLTWLMFIFIVFNIVFSSAAVIRWNERVTGTNNSLLPSQLYHYFDKNYDDALMLKYYPNMVHK